MQWQVNRAVMRARQEGKRRRMEYLIDCSARRYARRFRDWFRALKARRLFARRLRQQLREGTP